MRNPGADPDAVLESYDGTQSRDADGQKPHNRSRNVVNCRCHSVFSAGDKSRVLDVTHRRALRRPGGRDLPKIANGPAPEARREDVPVCWNCSRATQWSSSPAGAAGTRGMMSPPI
jgi:hypothetical protein